MENRLEQVRHSSAHVLAHALSELFPGTLFTIGPATETGFFYDFIAPRNLKQEDLEAVEQRMQEIVKRDIPITHREVSKDEARKLFKDNKFKLELIDEIPGETVGIAEQGNFFDLCRGGHVKSTGALGNFVLLGLSGSYWRADRDNEPLQRISGTAFLNPKDLRMFKKQREEALKYDHRKIGKELDLFSFQPTGPGFPFFHPRGLTTINILKDFMRYLLDMYGYKEISTPTMLSDELWKQSGHMSFYKENMYFSNIDDNSFAIKPMSCPGAFLVYNTRPRSYRELPLRLAEFGHVHRHELSGVLHGLLRVRAFTQDDAHIICTPDQVESEIMRVMEIIDITMKKMGFENLEIAIATRPADAMGDPEAWEQATEALKNALEKKGYSYTIKEGEGAFYGPKIEIGMKDSMGRFWQCGTIQVDFFQPENFDISYVAPSGKKERAVVIHHAIYGSLERFYAILLEHYKGRLPFWLAPTQIRILTITDEQKEYAQSLYDELKEQGLRVELDTSSDPISGQIKAAQQDKIPWMLILGKNEEDTDTVTIRFADGKQESKLSLDDLLEKSIELL